MALGRKRLGILFVSTAVLGSSASVGLALAHRAPLALAATTACPTGTSVTLQTTPCVKSGSKTGPVHFGSSLTQIAALPLQPGKWSVAATFYVQEQDGAGGNFAVYCRLDAGTDRSQSISTLPAVGGSGYYFPPDVVPSAGQEPEVGQSVALNVVHDFGSTSGSAALSCSAGNDPAMTGREVSAAFIRITAVRAGTLIDVPLA
jgi:hypothetical protein